ncbi:MAG: NAD(P)H-binding protein [Candidatus Latescibacteria bacterium]|nr:NAD(P)H-binding protein [Candidatus Latescibacterota bacterium]
MILVTGATGRIGRAVVAKLINEHGVVPRVLVRDRAKATAVLPDQVECIEGDFDNRDKLAAAFDGIARAMLLSPVHPRQVEWQGRAVEAAAPETHLVKISGLGTGLDSYVQSGLWHAQTEAQIERAGNPFTFLRPYFFMQNLAFQIDVVRRQGVIRSGVGAARIAMVDVDDIAAVVAGVLAGKIDLTNQACPLTGGQALDYRDMAGEFAHVLGRPVEYQEQSLDEIRANLQRGDMPAWHVEIILQFNRAFSEGWASQVDDTVARMLGRPPRSLGQFLADQMGGDGPSDSNPFPN